MARRVKRQYEMVNPCVGGLSQQGGGGGGGRLLDEICSTVDYTQSQVESQNQGEWSKRNLPKKKSKIYLL